MTCSQRLRARYEAGEVIDVDKIYLGVVCQLHLQGPVDIWPVLYRKTDS